MSVTTSTPPAPPPPIPPKRGGIHPTYGKFIGGSKLNDAYQTVGVSDNLYRFSTQRRHEKTITSIEQKLRDSRDSITTIKFNGTLEPKASVSTEIGKERFVTLLKKKVKEHGQQTFYWIRDTDGSVVDLFENAHRFKLDAVIAEHNRRMEVSGLFEAYDRIEKDEIELSRTVVESLLTESFQEKIEIRFSHRDDFELLPGSCLFIMAMETCNASVFHDVEGAKKKLEALDINNYPGENVTDLAGEAQRLLKIMQGAYALPVNTGSTLISKLTNTTSEFFNRKMYALLDVVMTLEIEYELKDPRLFIKDPEYVKYGPLAIVATIQATHGMLLSQQRWPALSSSLPQSNNSTVSTAGSASTALNGRKCFRCQGDHLVKDCPVPAPEGKGTGSSEKGTSRQKTALAAWKYIKPTDLKVPRVDANGKTWKFCTKCKCRATGVIGIYQLSHYDSEHVDNYRRPGSTPGANPAASSDTSEAPPEVPVSAGPTAPQSNLTSVANPNPIPPGPPDVTVRLEDDAHDFDQIEFTGMWCAMVDDTDARPSDMFQVQLYCTSVDSDITADATITSTPRIIVERENVSEFCVETVVDDDDLDEQTYVDNDVGTVITMFPDPDHEDFTDDDWDLDYPSTDDDSDGNLSTDNDSFEDVDDYFDDDAEVDPWLGANLSDEVHYDLLHPPEEDEFYDAYEMEPLLTTYKGVEFFDSIEAFPTYPMSWFRPRVENWVLRHFKVMMFWLSTMIWDTIIYFLSPPPLLPRRVRRRCRAVTVPAYPRTWMLFTSCLMLGMEAFQGQIPPLRVPTPSSMLKHVQACGTESYQRMVRLEEMVTFNAETLVQYQAWKYLTVHTLLDERRIISSRQVRTVQVEEEEDTNQDFLELDHFLDTYEEEPVENGENFFDSFETEHAESGYKPFDPMALHELCVKSSFVDCVTRSIASELEFDHQHGINGPTVLQKGLSSEAFQILASDPQALMTIGGGQRKPVIFDTGASLGITFDRDDFDGPLTIPEGDLRLGGMAQGLKIAGVGPVTWTFRNPDGSEIKIRSQCYYVPDAKVRLISPQRLFNKSKGVTGKFEGDEDTFTLQFDGGHRLVVEYDSRNHLPIGYATVGDDLPPMIDPQANLSLLDESNQNITAGHRLLLNWHGRFGHLNFPAVQRILRQFPFVSAKFAAASKCDLTDFRCEICQYAKAHRRTTHGKRTQPNEERDGALKAEHLGPGVRVSVDHFESRLLGRTRDSYGKPSSAKYKGGCIFVDHGTGYVHVEHQLGFSAVETIRAKQSFESMAFEHGVVVQSYLTDSGAFKANAFVQQIRDHGQHIRYCGTNAHHQNGVAERSIRTVSNMARAMLLHSAAHWKSGVDSSLWPMAVTYAVYIYNNTPNAQNLCPADLFTGSTVPRHRLRDLHTWGCPVYILDPALQAGQKLPRWSPRSRRGVFVGLSTIHSSEVPLVLNLQTGSITTQYHVVFDDRYSTVASLGEHEDPPPDWEDLCLENTLYVPTDTTPDTPLHLHDDWLTDEEREVKYRELQRQDRVRELQHPTQPDRATPDTISPTLSTPTTGSSEGGTTIPPFVQTHPDGTVTMPKLSHPASKPVYLKPPKSSETCSGPIMGPDVILPDHLTSAPIAPSPSVQSSSPSLRRSQRSTKGSYQSTKYMNEAYVSSLDRLQQCDSQTIHLAYLAEISTCCDTGIENVVDPRAYAAKTQGSDPDSPTFHQAMNGEHAEEYIKAMQLEITTLVQQRTWTTVPRTAKLNVLKSTWAFKLKRLPDGTPYRFKARFCARGDLQREGVDFFDTYAPVVQWSTIRLLLSMVLTEGWATRQVDYTNAFAQANLKEEVYLEFPKMFAPKSRANVVLKLVKSLYGLRQAPRTFFEKLRDGLLERGYTQSKNDACLFMKEGILCVVYVDDTIFAGAEASVLEEEIRALGVNDTEQQHKFQLRNEGEVGAFLGIQITKTGKRTFSLLQTGLIAKVLNAANMSDCNGVSTPTGNTPVGSDTEGAVFSESWQYRTVIGMLMYLAANTRPDIAFAVHQAARFSHAPRQSHAAAVKRILRYLKETQDKGLIMSPTADQRVDCYVDSDFAGAFAVENSQDPISVKSRTGYVIMYRGSPLLWVSKMQTQVALSTMEAEYVALSQSMRDLIPVRQILEEIMMIVFKVPPTIQYRSLSKAFEDVKAGSMLSSIEQSTVYEDNHACMKFARMAQLSPRTKHIGIPYHWFRSKVESLDIAIAPISTTKQLADQFTKGLSLVPFAASRKILMGW